MTARVWSPLSTQGPSEASSASSESHPQIRAPRLGSYPSKGLEYDKMPGPESGSLKKRLHFPKSSAPAGSQGTIGNAVPLGGLEAGLRYRAGRAWERVPGSEANRKETGRKGDAPLLLRWPERCGKGGTVAFISSGIHGRDVFQERRGRLESTQCAQSKRERRASGAASAALCRP